MQTLRVAYGDAATVSYTLTNPTINLSGSPTPTIEVDVVDVETGAVRTTIPCTILNAAAGSIYFSLEDASNVRSMNTMLFRVTIGTELKTIPANSEQGLWVY